MSQNHRLRKVAGMLSELEKYSIYFRYVGYVFLQKHSFNASVIGINDGSEYGKPYDGNGWNKPDKIDGTVHFRYLWKHLDPVSFNEFIKPEKVTDCGEDFHKQGYATRYRRIDNFNTLDYWLRIMLS